MATLRDLARCEGSRLDRRGALLTLVGGLAVAGFGFQIRAERKEIQERSRRRRHYAGRRGRKAG